MTYHLSSLITKKPYSPPTSLHFRSRKIRTTKYDIETPYLGLKLWNLVLDEYKTIESLADFQVKIKTWVPENCPSSLCKTYINQTGFKFSAW